jgi:hypothetical protein
MLGNKVEKFCCEYYRNIHLLLGIAIAKVLNFVKNYM